MGRDPWPSPTCAELVAVAEGGQKAPRAAPWGRIQSHQEPAWGEAGRAAHWLGDHVGSQP